MNENKNTVVEWKWSFYFSVWKYQNYKYISYLATVDQDGCWMVILLEIKI